MRDILLFLRAAFSKLLTSKHSGSRNGNTLEKIRIEGDMAIRELNKDTQRFDLNTLQYAYLDLSDNGNTDEASYLCLNDEMFIRTTSKGFAEVYHALSERFGFDDEAFFAQKNHKTPVKRLLWRKKQQTSYSILSGHDDYALGFEIQAPQKQFIHWGITYEELARNEHLQFDDDPYRTATFKYPVRFGNILVNSLTHRFNWPRQDVPVTCFMAHCYHESSTDISYHQIKKELMRSASSFSLAKDDNDWFSFGDEDTFYFDDIALEITYFYGSQTFFEQGYTLFKALNHNHYPQYLINLPYENQLVVSDHLVIEELIGITQDYMIHTRVKRRPEKIIQQFKDASVIWRDDVNQKIGIAVAKYSLVFDLDEIAYFPIGNVHPAKGSGSSTLSIITMDEQGAVNYPTLDKPEPENCQTFFKGNSVGIIHEEFGFFDRYASRIEHLTGKKVIPMDLGYNC